MQILKSEFKDLYWERLKKKSKFTLVNVSSTTRNVGQLHDCLMILELQRIAFENGKPAK